MSDLILNGRSPAKKGGDFCTRDEATALAQAVAVKVSEHYMQQMPGFVSEIIIKTVPGLVAEMLRAHGIVLAPPPEEETRESKQEESVQ